MTDSARVPVSAEGAVAEIERILAGVRFNYLLLVDDGKTTVRRWSNPTWAYGEMQLFCKRLERVSAEDDGEPEEGTP